MKSTFCVFLLTAFAIFAGCEKPTDHSDRPDRPPSADGSDTKPNTELSGKIEIDGSSTVFPISEAAAAAFKKNYSNVDIAVGQSGTGGGFKRFTKGETDISDASRPIKVKEFQACQASEVQFIELPVAYDGLTIVVNKKNTFLKQVTVDQLKKIFLGDDAAKTWKDVDDSWPDEKIKIYAPGTDSGTFDYFKEVVAGKTGSFRGDMSTSEDDHVLVNGVIGDEFALGFFGAAYYFQNKDKLNSVAVINKAGDAVSPSAETIENGSYNPFSRPLFIYMNKASMDKAQVEKFVEFYLEKAADFATQVGYVPLPAEVYESAKDRFLDGDVGTHYLTPEMEKRSGPVTEVYKKENLIK
ncbi:UNVERIFIED_CONTAM: hypothetical protein GTU68_009590 [Idotea baltica]|nr:hypothetical protein [Idotea baltica]